MTEKGKERLKKAGHIALTTLAFALMSAFIGGICWLYAKTSAQAKEANEPATILNAPKKVNDGDRIYVTNQLNTAIDVWQESYSTHEVTLIWTISAENVFSFVAHTNNYDYWIEANQNKFWVKDGDSNDYVGYLDYTYAINTGNSTDLIVTSTAPMVTLKNDFPTVTGDALLMMPLGWDSLEDAIENIQAGEQVSMSWDYMVDKEYIKIAATEGAPYVREQFNVTTANTQIYQGGAWQPTYSSTAAQINAGNLIFSFEPITAFFTIENNTMYSFEYWHGTDGSPTDPGETWLTLNPFTTIRAVSGHRYDFFTNRPFTITYGNQVIASTKVNQDYYIIIDNWQQNAVINDPGAIDGSAGQILSNTFHLVGEALTALMPILNLQIMENITIGVLLFIPLTFAIIVLIVKLIKL